MLYSHEEEERESGPFWSWMIIILFCVVIVAWGILNYLMIPDSPRHWDLGVLRDLPGQSIYSTASRPAVAPAPEQIVPLPEGVPLEGKKTP